ncbi:MAG: hypothetical protein SGI86_11570 [Deltaproteobacteria bacterium]|nr:hypothetical protein [Deltaproteobacteria bacterium]
MKVQQTMTPSQTCTKRNARRGCLGLWIFAVLSVGTIAFSSAAFANGGQWGGPKTIRRVVDAVTVESSADPDQLVRL